ncbi:hypothetical protein OIU78_025075 [Salix suchowensis]|nr:hypothetical protein OIU78_025075 [Salix suchowensis]
MLLHRQTRNTIHNLKDATGNQVTGREDLGHLAINYYKNLLATPTTPHHNYYHHFPTPNENTMNVEMAKNITEEEIQEAIFSIPDDKAPGLDGFTSKFYKHGWAIIKDFVAAIRYFYQTLIMPKLVNATYIALVPKNENLETVNEYRPM